VVCTHSFWVNYLCAKWASCDDLELLDTKDKLLIFQMLDFCVLDSDSRAFSPRQLALGMLYLQMTRKYSPQSLSGLLKTKSVETLVNDESEVNSQFALFLELVRQDISLE